MTTMALGGAGQVVTFPFHIHSAKIDICYSNELFSFSALIWCVIYVVAPLYALRVDFVCVTQWQKIETGKSTIVTGSGLTQAHAYTLGHICSLNRNRNIVRLWQVNLCSPIVLNAVVGCCHRLYLCVIGTQWTVLDTTDTFIYRRLDSFRFWKCEILHFTWFDAGHARTSQSSVLFVLQQSTSMYQCGGHIDFMEFNKIKGTNSRIKQNNKNNWRVLCRHRSALPLSLSSRISIGKRLWLPTNWGFSSKHIENHSSEW